MVNIIKLLEISKSDLKTFLEKGATITGKNFIYHKGNSPFCLVSHIDTLTSGKIRCHVKNNIVKNQFGILGADDRAGVYACLKLYQDAPENNKPHLLFLDGEESGGIGAKEASRNLNRPEGINLLLEFDRRGCNEYVFYNNQPKQICTYIESFGFKEEFGSYSDIADLSPAWNIPAINLSIGYYNQHTTRETLHLDEMELTIARVKRMFNKPVSKLHKLPRDYDYFSWNQKYPDMWEKDYKRTGKVISMNNCTMCDSMLTGQDIHQPDGLCASCAEYFENHIL